MPTAKETGFVPEMYLSSYVHEQLSALHHCDTITVDPHKSGFCPYPGGAICYRDRRMNSFLSITTKVLYYHGKMILGDVGIEGSKPGAAAVGVMMANRVIIQDCFSDIGSKQERYPQYRRHDCFISIHHAVKWNSEDHPNISEDLRRLPEYFRRSPWPFLLLQIVADVI